MSSQVELNVQLSTTKQETVRYHNPVVTGFNPDPSVVYVDGIFYMATSTFQYFPGIPIHASTNLREWKLIGQ
jgi:beta-xylosidase